MNKATVFISGSGGFIGSHLTKFLETDMKVIKVGRASGDIKFDLTRDDPEALSLVCKPGDLFIHLAAESSPDKCTALEGEAFDINVTKTNSLIRVLTSAGVRVLFASSDAVFGQTKGPALDDDILKPCGIYGRMKQLVEIEVERNALVKIARFSYIVGRGDKFSAMLADAECTGKTVDIFSGFQRNIIHISDVIIAIKSLIDTWDDCEFSKVNFSGPSLVDRAELVEVMAAKVFPHLKYRITEAPAGFWDSRARVTETDCRNLSLLLGRRPQGIEAIGRGW